MRLTDLDPVTRRLCILGLVLSAAASAVILIRLISPHVPWDSTLVRQIGFQVKPGLGAMAWPWVLLVSAGFGIAAAIFVAASRRTNWPLHRLMIAVVAVAGAAAAAQQVQLANAFGPLRGSGGLQTALYLGWTGLGLAGLLLLLAIACLPSSR